MMFRAFILSILFLFNTTHASVGNLQAEQVSQSIEQGVTIIDIRTPEEWKETGTIKNAHRIMFFDQKGRPLIDDFMSQFNKIVTHKDQKVILVCRSGNRTGMVSKFLDEKLGYTHVSHLARGMKQWISQKRSVEK